MRSPSIFFIPFNASTFRFYLTNKETNLDLSENFSLIDILLSFFISYTKQEDHDDDTKQELAELITFLLKLRISKTVNESLPEYIRYAKEKNDLPLRVSLVENFVNLIEKCPEIFEKGVPVTTIRG